MDLAPHWPAHCDAGRCVQLVMPNTPNVITANVSQTIVLGHLMSRPLSGLCGDTKFVLAGASPRDLLSRVTVTGEAVYEMKLARHSKRRSVVLRPASQSREPRRILPPRVRLQPFPQAMINRLTRLS